MQTANIDQALALIAEHFCGMTDQDGEPYVMHCLRVMMGCNEPDAQLVGLMHDLVEDTAVTIDDLTKTGFSPAVTEAVELVTHREGISYADYVVALKTNPLAREAKLADLRDNASMSRVLYRAESPQGDVNRIQRYVLSYQYLENRIDELSYREQMTRIDK